MILQPNVRRYIELFPVNVFVSVTYALGDDFFKCIFFIGSFIFDMNRTISPISAEPIALIDGAGGGRG